MENSIEILAFDLDGTCLQNHQEISPRNRRALEKAAERGVLLLPATGRNLQAVPACIMQMPEIRYVMTANGASIYDKKAKSVIYRDLIPNQTARRAQKVLDAYSMHIEYYIEGDAYTIKDRFLENFEKMDFPEAGFKDRIIGELLQHFRFVEDFQLLLSEERICPEKVNMVPVAQPVFGELKQRLEAIGGLSVTTSYPRNMEFNAKTATKGSTLRRFSRQRGVPAKAVMALGDSGNDVGMLQYAGRSFAMANGIAQAKAAAKEIADDCLRDGLGKAVEQVILGEI